MNTSTVESLETTTSNVLEEQGVTWYKLTRALTSLMLIWPYSVFHSDWFWLKKKSTDKIWLKQAIAVRIITKFVISSRVIRILGHLFEEWKTYTGDIVIPSTILLDNQNVLPDRIVVIFRRIAVLNLILLAVDHTNHENRIQLFFFLMVILMIRNGIAPKAVCLGLPPGRLTLGQVCS